MSTTTSPPDAQLSVRHHVPANLADRLALGLVKILRFFANTFFQRRYGHRTVILETIAAVPVMVGGTLCHVRSLRRFEDDHRRGKDNFRASIGPETALSKRAPGTHSPFATLHKSGSYRRFICRALAVAGRVSLTQFRGRIGRPAHARAQVLFWIRSKNRLQ